MTIDWARIPADQHEAIQASLDRARAGEPEPDEVRPPPTTARDAIQDWLNDHRKGGYVTYEVLEAALVELADWVDRASLPAAEAWDATHDPGVDVTEPGEDEV